MSEIILLLKSISFGWQPLLLLLPLPWLAARWLPLYRPPRLALRIPQLQKLLALPISHQTGARQSAPPAWSERLLRSLIWILVVVAAAQPYRLGPPIEHIEVSREILLALDVSGSMDIRDIFIEEFAEEQRISRMDSVQRVVNQFLQERETERFGLAVFGSQAFPYVPFTSDTALLQQKTDEIYPGIAGEQTAIGDALGVAITLFEQSNVPEKVVILLTDGSDTASSLPPQAAARLAADHDVTVHAIAFGQVDPGEGINQRASQEEIIDLQMLETIAGMTGGQVFVGDNHDSLQGIFEELDSLLVSDNDPQYWSQHEFLFHYPLALAALMFALLALLSLNNTLHRRKEA
ncbi:VWA domain-containing protein [Endozoicomonas lisbonensis]|uniref:Ca-activated chloride channel family protein n=1 Tax=Endozoicomonas lisbonensis TaxID=3120522 RepID=A0ABV2SBK8_9GAMM